MRTTDSSHDTTADARPYSPERTSSLDATLDALADARCRSVLGHLADGDADALVVGDLATRLADDEGDDRTSDPSRLRARLHHTVLPRLDDAGLLDYDADRGLVRRRRDSAFEAVREVIEAYERDGDRENAVASDRLFDLLVAFRRRAAYRVLLRHGDISLPDLADEVAVAETGQPLPEVDADHVLRVYLSLYHTHVPKLAGSGLASYDQDGDYVTLTETGRALEPTVRRLVEAAGA